MVGVLVGDHRLTGSIDFQALFDAAPGIYLVLTPDFEMVAANEARLRATMTTREEIIGLNLFDVFPDNPDDPEADGVSNLRRSLERVLKTKAADTMAVQKYDIPRPASEGGGFELRYWSPMNLPVLGPDGEVAYIIHRVEDVTDFVRLKQEETKLQSHAERIENEVYQRAREVQDANRRLEEANAELGRLYEKTKELDAAKTRFFANISHELRTPLTLILGPVERMLSDSVLPDEQRRPLEVVGRNARLLLHHVNDLLDIAKLDAGKMDVRYSEIDLALLLRAMSGHFESLADDRDIAFDVDTPVSVFAEADMEKVQRVLLNLLSNAFKFTPDGGRIGMRLLLEGFEACIIVEDSGPGVPEALRQVIFEPFRQGEEKATRRFGGTGLGLAIAKEFLDLLGGNIAVRESANGGALFEVRLPIKAPEGAIIVSAPGLAAPDLRAMLDVQRPDAARALSDAESHSKADRALVLIVEDNREMNNFIAEGLMRFYRVARAFNGMEGLEKAEELAPDLIVTDMMMPGLSGEQLVQEIRARPAFEATPVILLTAKADDETRLGLLRRGVQDVLTKPFNSDELLARVANLLEAKQAGDLLRERLRQSQKLEAMGQLTGGVAHDFNNLLTVFAAAADSIAVRAQDQPALLAQVSAIEHAVERGSALTKRLLAFARQQKLILAPLDLNEVCVRLIDLLGRTLGEHIEISTNLTPDLWRVMADGAQVEDALLNLSLNARDAMPEGGRLIVQTENVILDADYAMKNPDAAPGAYGAVYVTDSGAGMAPNILARAFEPLFTTKDVGKGTGLGLSMVYGFAKQSGGHVKLYSEVGHGTSVRLYLPRAGVHETGAAAPAGASPQRGEGEHILIVEDDAGVREVAASMLVDLGYRVHVCEDGPAALKVLESEAPVDLIFTDIVMPRGLSGIDLMDEVRARRPGVKVLLASGYSEEFFKLQAGARLNLPLLMKPYRRQSLATAVREALGLKGGHLELEF